jgi:hypothetical protein
MSDLSPNGSPICSTNQGGIASSGPISQSSLVYAVLVISYKVPIQGISALLLCPLKHLQESTNLLGSHIRHLSRSGPVNLFLVLLLLSTMYLLRQILYPFCPICPLFWACSMASHASHFLSLARMHFRISKKSLSPRFQQILQCRTGIHNRIR